jgi:hypothetical protein
MGTGLPGENGLDPETAMSMIRTFILPILTISGRALLFR